MFFGRKKRIRGCTSTAAARKRHTSSQSPDGASFPEPPFQCPSQTAGGVLRPTKKKEMAFEEARSAPPPPTGILWRCLQGCCIPCVAAPRPGVGNTQKHVRSATATARNSNGTEPGLGGGSAQARAGACRLAFCACWHAAIVPPGWEPERKDVGH